MRLDGYIRTEISIVVNALLGDFSRRSALSVSVTISFAFLLVREGADSSTSSSSLMGLRIVRFGRADMVVAEAVSCQI